MPHLSLFWLPQNKELHLKGLESEFLHLVTHSIQSGTIKLPPIPSAVLEIQRLCMVETTTISDINNCLIEDPGLTAMIIKVANSIIFNRRDITCIDLFTAVSRLGIFRVRDIITAKAIEQLKFDCDLNSVCKKTLKKSAQVSKQLAATMVLITRMFKTIDAEKYQHIEYEKALLSGLLADIGLFSLINEYHTYHEGGNYLDPDIAMQVFDSTCSKASYMVLNNWGFDTDFLDVASNQTSKKSNQLSYLDIARIANHLLMFVIMMIDLMNTMLNSMLMVQKFSMNYVIYLMLNSIKK